MAELLRDKGGVHSGHEAYCCICVPAVVRRPAVDAQLLRQMLGPLARLAGDGYDGRYRSTCDHGSQSREWICWIFRFLDWLIVFCYQLVLQYTEKVIVLEYTEQMSREYKEVEGVHFWVSASQPREGLPWRGWINFRTKVGKVYHDLRYGIPGEFNLCKKALDAAENYARVICDSGHVRSLIPNIA